MSVIIRNDFGAIAVNKGVIERMIIEDLLEMNDTIILCNKKGKPIKPKSQKATDADYFDAIEVYQKKQLIKVKVFVISIFGCSISQIADDIFDRIEKDFDLLKLDKPGSISVNYRGIMTPKQLIKRNMEICRRNY